MSGATGTFRVALYSPDRARLYDGRIREAEGVGGGITARLSLLEALAALGHQVTAHVHCAAPITHRGVAYVPLDSTRAIDCDIFVAISTGGALTFAPLRGVNVTARLRMLWVQGAPKPAAIDAVRADRVCVASNFLREVCASRWGVDPARLFVCYNGIHQEYFREVEAAPSSRDPHALAFIGPPEKGLDACVGVLRRLRQHDSRYRLDVFGGAELWGRPPGPAVAEPGVTFKGVLGQRQLAHALFGYEYALAIQDMAEGFGMAVQEAKRAGAIVVASTVGALGELIRHGADGYLVPPPAGGTDAEKSAADLILDLAADPLRRRRVRRRAMQTPWNWDMAARTWTAYWRHELDQVTAGTRQPSATLDLPDGRHRLRDGRPRRVRRVKAARVREGGVVGERRVQRHRDGAAGPEARDEGREHEGGGHLHRRRDPEPVRRCGRVGVGGGRAAGDDLYRSGVRANRHDHPPGGVGGARRPEDTACARAGVHLAGRIADGVDGHGGAHDRRSGAHPHLDGRGNARGLDGGPAPAARGDRDEGGAGEV
jgi:glycosyltransferase involved in cell wall biosynthesis